MERPEVLSVKILGAALGRAGLAENEMVLMSVKSTPCSVSRLSPLNLNVRVDAAGVFQNSCSSGFIVEEGVGLAVLLPSVRSR
jgi:hypothetical protein